MLYLGSDHAGFHLKEAVKEYLAKQKIEFHDLGNHAFEPEDDFPDYAKRVAEKVAGTKHRGILFCGSATGMVIAANKFSSIRAGAVFTDYMARQAKEHDDVNVLVLAGRLINKEEAQRFTHIWLRTKFSKEKKYRRRVNKTKQFEDKSTL